MINKINLLGILVMMLVFGMTVVGNLEAQTDRQLNGTWITFSEGVENELRLRNGNFEDFVNGVPFSKGTYTTNNGKIDWTLTQFFGEGMNQLIMTILGSNIGLESKWYSRNEFILLIRPALMRLGFPEEIINEFITIIISPPQDSYSVDGNTLITTSTSGSETIVSVYNRKN